ncbi:MAG: VWA domain-containing protein [Planctomycetota bacterium]|nr:VWA domain-containing protein [Planctomycetota bacterium]
MTWLTPTIAGIAAAIAVPSLIILYFLKLRRRDVEISTTLLWKKTIQDMQANAPFQRLRKNILLFLQLLVLAGVLLALAQPQMRGLISGGTQRIILIDRSASMAATDGDADNPGQMSRLDKAKETALKLIDSLREPSLLGSGTADEAMIIAFDTTAEVRQQFTADKARLRAAIESIEPSDAPSLLSEALRLARAHLPDKVLTDVVTDDAGNEVSRENITIEGAKIGGATIHLFSDGRLPDAEEAITSEEDKVTFIQVGRTDAANVGITAMRADRAFDSPVEVSLYVGLQNTARTPQEVELELLIDGITTRVTKVTIPPAIAPISIDDADADEDAQRLADLLPWTPGVAGRTFEFEQTAGGVFAVQITPTEPESDLLPVDNRAWIIVPPARQLSVALVSRGNLFLITALQGLPLARLVQYTPGQYQSAAGTDEIAAFDVIIFDGWLPTIDGQPGLPPGRFLVLNAIPAPLGIAAGTEPQSATVLDWPRDHAVMRLLLLDKLRILYLPDIVNPDGSDATVLAETDKGPAIFEISRAQTRALVVPFDIAESTWPLDTSFVVFVGAGVNYVGQEGGVFGASGDALRPGSVLTDRLPIGASAVRLRAPGDSDRVGLEPANDGRIAYGPIRRAGLYEASWVGPAGAGDTTDGGRVTRTYAANLLDPRESDIAAAPLLRLSGETVMLQDADETEATIRLWPWAILVALAILMLEWYIYNRKVHV